MCQRGIHRMLAHMREGEARSQGSHEVIGHLVRMAGEADSVARCWVDKTGLDASQGHCRMHHRDNDAAVGPAESSQFEKKPF